MNFRRDPYRSLLITTILYIIFFGIILYNEFDIHLLPFNESLPVELSFDLGTEEVGSEMNQPQQSEDMLPPLKEESVLTQPNTSDFNAAVIKTGDTSTVEDKNDSVPSIVGNNTNVSSNDTSAGGSVGDGDGNSDMVYSANLVSQHARFLGGSKDKFGEWLGRDIRANEVLMESKIEGSIIVSFIVDIDGKLTDIRILKGISPKVDNEIINMIKKSPAWEPGKQQDHPVKILYQMPIYFSN